MCVCVRIYEKLYQTRDFIFLFSDLQELTHQFWIPVSIENLAQQVKTNEIYIRLNVRPILSDIT